MTATKESFRSEVESLVTVYGAHEHEFKNNREYNEFSLRREFLDGFFGALGWDMRNEGRKAPHEREVRFERPNEKRKRPDYTFLIDGRARFIVEAKAPGESLDNSAAINQAKSYAWNSSEAAVAILTNFNGFKVYDGSLKPDREHPERGLLREFGFRDYLANIDFLWSFARDPVSQGSLEELLPKRTRDRQYRVPVDEAFLADVSNWRELLAKDLYRRSPEIGPELLNEVVQRTLDRLVFIRMAEDRGIIPYTSLWDVLQTWKQQNPNRPIQGMINDLYHRIRLDLDGEIFEHHACELPEYWFTPSVLAGLIEGLYFPKSPYLFDVIGIELLGSIYERYLGKTLRFTEKRVKLEEKPEVRKAGGVFYTPRPIVEYIVETAIGDRISGHSPQQMTTLRVLDPACGSGSFLVAAFGRIVEEHVRFYEKHPGSAGRGTLFPDLIVEGETSRLSIEKKAEILRNSVFGVDIDPQAVEVTMMSLYLKALEGEQSLPSNKALLPRLKQNIRCGNSLVEPGKLGQQTLDGTRIGTELNPFDWQSKEDGFGAILGSRKFDAVIGNPPYIRIQQLREWAPAEADYIQANFSTARKGDVDIYIAFIERAIDLVRPGGSVGFIVSHKFFQAHYGDRLRNLITSGRMLDRVVYFGHRQVFPGPTTYTCLLFLDPRGRESFRYAEVGESGDLSDRLRLLREAEGAPGKVGSEGLLPQLEAGPRPWHLSASPNLIQLLSRLQSRWPNLGSATERIFQGCKTGADAVFILSLTDPSEWLPSNRGLVNLVDEKSGRSYRIEAAILRPLVKSSEMRRFHILPPERAILFPYRIEGEKGVLLQPADIERRFPRAWQYLQGRKSELKARRSATEWWGFSRLQSIAQFAKPKLLTPDFAPSARFSYDSEGGLHFPGGAAGGYGILPKQGVHPLYLLGLLNSSLLDALLQTLSTPFRGGWHSYEDRFIRELPIRTVGETEDAAKTLHDAVVGLTGRLVELEPRLDRLPPSSERDRLEREVRRLNAELDESVEALYGLSSTEKEALHPTRPSNPL